MGTDKDFSGSSLGVAGCVARANRFCDGHRRFIGERVFGEDGAFHYVLLWHFHLIKKKKRNGRETRISEQEKTAGKKKQKQLKIQSSPPYGLDLIDWCWASADRKHPSRNRIIWKLDFGGDLIGWCDVSEWPVLVFRRGVQVSWLSIRNRQSGIRNRHYSGVSHSPLEGKVISSPFHSYSALKFFAVSFLLLAASSGRGQGSPKSHPPVGLALNLFANQFNRPLTKVNHRIIPRVSIQLNWIEFWFQTFFFFFFFFYIYSFYFAVKELRRNANLLRSWQSGSRPASVIKTSAEKRL